MWRRNAATVIAAVVLAAFLLLYMSTYQVRFNEVAIVKTFGEITHVEWEPGLGFRWPWPIQQVVKYDLRVNILEDPLSETQTQGGKPVFAQAYMAWRIKDPEKFLKNIGTVTQAKQQLRKLLKARKEEMLGQYSLANFVSTDPSQLKLQEVEDKILEIVGRQAMEQYGIEVVAVGLKRLGVPGSTSEQIFAAMRQGRQELAEKYRSEGRAEANSIRSRADAISKKIMYFAQRRAEELKAQGYAAAAEAYKVFREDERFAIFLKELGTLKQTLVQNTTIVLDWTLRPFSFFQAGPSLPDQVPRKPRAPVLGKANAPSAPATRPASDVQ